MQQNTNEGNVSENNKNNEKYNVIGGDYELEGIYELILDAISEQLSNAKCSVSHKILLNGEIKKEIWTSRGE